MTVSFYFFIVQKYGENNNKKRENSYKGRGVSLFIEYCDRLLLKPPLQSGVLGTQTTYDLSSTPHFAFTQCLEFFVQFFTIIGLRIGIY